MPEAFDALRLAVDRFTVREHLERYCACLDARDFEGVAACFTHDAEAAFGSGVGDADPLVGGKAIADWLRVLDNYRESIHAVSHVTVAFDGAEADVGSLLVATLIGGPERSGRAYVRGIRYTDRMVRRDGGWLIRRRRHRPLWQYEALSQVPGLPEPPRTGAASP